MKGRAGSAASAPKATSARHVTTLLKDALPPEEAARADDQHHDHDPEDRDRHALRVHPEGEEALRGTDGERGHDGAAHRAHAAQDHDDERERSEERRVGKECRSRWSPY